MDKNFFPLIDNGLRTVKSEFTYSALRSFSGRLHKTCRISSPYPTRALNMCTGAFMRSDCSHMVIIDTDLSFEPHDLDMLLSHDLPLVFGCYWKKGFPLERCCVPFGQNERVDKLRRFIVENPLDIPPDELLDEENPFGGDEPLVEVERCGRGFMRVHRDVFEKMKPGAMTYDTHGPLEVDYWKEGVFDDEWLSEDWKFCDDWRALGGKILIDQRIKLTHHGDYGFGEESNDSRITQLVEVNKHLMMQVKTLRLQEKTDGVST